MSFPPTRGANHSLFTSPDFSPKGLKKAASCGISFFARKRCATNRRQLDEDRLVPAFALAALAVAIPTVASLLLVALFGHETRGRDLRELELVSVPMPVVGKSISAD